MSEPTFLYHFSKAVQSDILRQAAVDQRRHQAREIARQERPEAPSRRLFFAARLLATLRGDLGPEGRRATVPSCSLPEHGGRLG